MLELNSRYSQVETRHNMNAPAVASEVRVRSASDMTSEVKWERERREIDEWEVGRGAAKVEQMILEFCDQAETKHVEVLYLLYEMDL